MAQNWRIDERELNYVKDVLTGGFPGGGGTNYVGKLEAAFAERFGVKYAVTFCNGTATMHAALAAAGIGPGDEVIVPPLTMSSTTFAVIHAGATPVYADIDPDTFVMDAAAARRCVTPRTRAIMPVSLYGLAPTSTPSAPSATNTTLSSSRTTRSASSANTRGASSAAWATSPASPSRTRST